MPSDKQIAREIATDVVNNYLPIRNDTDVIRRQTCQKLLESRIEALLAAARQPEPIPMVIFCPYCHAQHVDKAEPDKGWENPPHKSHLCHSCGAIFRLADVPTDGVAAITTKGEADRLPNARQPEQGANELNAVQVAYNQGVEDAKAAVRSVGSDKWEGSEFKPYFITEIARTCSPHRYVTPTETAAPQNETRLVDCVVCGKQHETPVMKMFGTTIGTCPELREDEQAVIHGPTGADPFRHKAQPTPPGELISREAAIGILGYFKPPHVPDEPERPLTQTIDAMIAELRALPAAPADEQEK